MIYYFRKTKDKEEYYVYQNTSLTRVGEVLHGITDSWDKAMIWIENLYEYKALPRETLNWFDTLNKINNEIISNN